MAQAHSGGSEMPYAGAPCTGDGGVSASAEQTASFRRFDMALRSALKRQDAAAIAFLVHFPLRVNTSRGTVLIPDAYSLSGHYAEIFPAKVRDQILATGNDDYICRYDEGLGYGRGVIWVSTDDKRFALEVVNEPDEHAKQQGTSLVFTCETKTHRISIEDLNNGNFRYRAWKKPRELSETPDLEIADGKQNFEGTGICVSSVYTFTRGNIQYSVSRGLGCTDGKEPEQATGELHVTAGDKDVTQDWCF